MPISQTQARFFDLLEWAGSTAGVVAALEAVRPVSARPEFVADLRARLMADTTADTGLDLPARQGPSGVPSRRRLLHVCP